MISSSSIRSGSGLVHWDRSTIRNMDLSQLVGSPTHVAGHTLNLISLSGGNGDLKVEGLHVNPLSWADHPLVSFRLAVGVNILRNVGPIKMVHSKHLMKSHVFLSALGELPTLFVSAIAESLTDW